MRAEGGTLEAGNAQGENLELGNEQRIRIYKMFGLALLAVGGATALVGVVLGAQFAKSEAAFDKSRWVILGGAALALMGGAFREKGICLAAEERRPLNPNRR